MANEANLKKLNLILNDLDSDLDDLEIDVEWLRNRQIQLTELIKELLPEVKEFEIKEIE